MVINFNEALLKKRDREFEQRQIVPNLFQKKARASEAEIDQAIFDFEIARAKWRCAKNK